MIPEKGFDLTLNAFSKLDSIHRYRLILGGDGPEKDNLIKIAKRLGINKKVEFPGWLSYESMARYLADCDIFILPRWRKELSSVILFEAMAMAMPTIVMGGGALEWLVGNNDLTFKENDAEDLANKIILVSRDLKVRKEYGVYCYERFMNNFNFKILAKELNNIFLKLFV